MTKIAITPNPSGTGTFTLAAPNSNTNRTLTLPDATGEVLTTAALSSTPDAEAGTGTGIMNSTLTAEAIAAQETKPTIFTSTISSAVAFVSFTGLAGFNRLEIEVSVVKAVSATNLEIQLSANNGSTWLTSGYRAGVHDGVSGSTNTAGFTISRTDTTEIFGQCVLTSLGLARNTTYGSVMGGLSTRVSAAGGRYDSDQAHNAIRFIAGSGNINSGFITIRAWA
jgi:hypothetical protein